MHIKKSSSRKFYRMGVTLKFKIVLFVILFFSFCSSKNENPFFLNIEYHWAYLSYRINIFEDGRVFISAGKFNQMDYKRSFRVSKDTRKKIQNSVVEYVKARKAELINSNSFRFCSDCGKINLEYYDGFEKEYYFSDQANKEDFIKLEKELEEWENLLGITEEDKKCVDCK